MDNIADRIYELIAGKLNNELTEEEQKELDELMGQSLEYQILFENIKGLHHNVKLLHPIFDPDLEVVLKKVKSGKVKQVVFRKFIHYAAILLLPLFIGLVWSQLNQEKEIVTENRDFSAISSPGSNKAVLLLNGGRQIILDQLTSGTFVPTGQGTMISTDSNRMLSYQFDSLKEKDVVEWNTLSVPRGGEYQLLLSDGTRVWLNSSSVLTFPQLFQGAERRVKLSGEAFFEVAKDAAHPFIVDVNQIKVKVLGTKFNINSYETEGNIYTTLLEGGVEVINDQHQTVRLNPGEQACGNSMQLTKKEVNVIPYTSWREGKFTFSNTDLEEICKQISRWYDVDIFFASERIKDIRFTGAILKFLPLDDMVRMIEMTSSVRFSVKNKTILISEN